MNLHYNLHLCAVGDFSTVVVKAILDAGLWNENPDKLKKLSRCLETEQDTLIQIEKSLSNRKLSAEGKLLAVLLEWQCRTAEKASITSLVNILKEEGLKDIATTLESQFLVKINQEDSNVKTI